MWGFFLSVKQPESKNIKIKRGVSGGFWVKKVTP